MSDFLILICVILVPFCIFMAFKSSDKRKEEIEKLHQQLNQLPNFKPKKTLIKYYITGNKGISIDDDSKQICLIVNNQLILKPFTDIIETQVVVDGKTITKTSRGSQALGMAVGGVLGGGLGLLIGGLTASTSETKKIKNVSIKLLMNDLTTPVHEVGLIGVSPATGYEPLNLALTQAEEWDNLLKIVLFQGKEERSNPKPQEQSV